MSHVKAFLFPSNSEALLFVQFVKETESHFPTFPSIPRRFAFSLRIVIIMLRTSSHLSNIFFQVFLLLVKRLASLHYNHPQDLPQDNSSSFKSLVKAPISDDSFLTINNCQAERGCNTNSRTKSIDADYDEVDFQSTSDCRYIEQINETIDKSSRTHKNMGSNVSTAGGKGLSGRRTQSSSKCFSCSLNMHKTRFYLSDLEIWNEY